MRYLVSTTDDKRKENAGYAGGRKKRMSQKMERQQYFGIFTEEIDNI